MLILWTTPKSIISLERGKILFRTLQKKVRGPSGVIRSLKDGLKATGQAFEMDIYPKAGDTLHVVCGVGTLKEAIDLKKKGDIKTLIAGPNIVVSPLDNEKILCNPLIDTIIVPSAWVKDFYVSLAPEIAKKIRIWPAGVSDPGEPSAPRAGRKEVVIYQKNAPDELLQSVIRSLSEKNIPFTVIRYGSFEQEDYYKLLASAAFMVYLSESESQGLAVHEAWIRNVPTLVWNRGFWQYNGQTWKDEKISAPYLTPACGYFFKDAHEFSEQVQHLSDSSSEINPRAYSLEHFSDSATTRQYLDVINENRS